MQRQLGVAVAAANAATKSTEAALENAAAAIDMAQLMRLQLTTNQIIERAYVDLSHDPPGLTIKGDEITFSIAVKTHGRTPARVSRPKTFLVVSETDRLPLIPPTPRAAGPRAIARAPF